MHQINGLSEYRANWVNSRLVARQSNALTCKVSVKIM